jgi:hypothetical protein
MPLRICSFRVRHVITAAFVLPLLLPSSSHHNRLSAPLLLCARFCGTHVRSSLLRLMPDPRSIPALSCRRSLRGRPRQATAVRGLAALRAGLLRAAAPQLHPRTPEPRAFRGPCRACAAAARLHRKSRGKRPRTSPSLTRGARTRACARSAPAPARPFGLRSTCALQCRIAPAPHARSRAPGPRSCRATPRRATRSPLASAPAPLGAARARPRPRRLGPRARPEPEPWLAARLGPLVRAAPELGPPATAAPSARAALGRSAPLEQRPAHRGEGEGEK